MGTIQHTRLILEAGLACVSAVGAFLTLLIPDWVEEIFGFDPDQHSGVAEWMIVGALIVVAVAAAIAARVEWRRFLADIAKID